MAKQPDFVKVLLRPETYAHHPQKVELVQTQMSFIFLAGEFVYKVKKPVDLGYLDYTTLEKRRYFCQQELELNRRLCPEAYLEVVPIVSHQGRIYLGGNGEVIEYAVKMKFLPADRMMDRLLPQNLVTKDMVADVAGKLAAFHGQAKTSADIGGYGKTEAIKVNSDENFDQTEKYIDISIPDQTFRKIKAYTDDFLKANKPLFEKRVREGKIRDCHGDLHAAHVCLADGICIFDCIEFNDRFRYGDVASEVAFLAMDLDRFRHPELSKSFVDAYVRISGDKDLLQLLNFYKCYRAYVRGKVTSFMLDDKYIPETEKTGLLETARMYFELAESYV